MLAKKGPMKPCRPLAALVLLAAALLCGCASSHVSLYEVREFADASARLGAYGELSKRYRDTYLREQPYLSPAADRIARENDAKRRAVFDDFVSAQKALVLYMQTLSMLVEATPATTSRPSSTTWAMASRPCPAAASNRNTCSPIPD
ncbi:hypothetical protein LP420_05535 [Massilia sp. B-10]|nr:hypothetical protein LP420_05535 [Massilia sp. B-10]